jgi:hypothetical protein
MAKQVKKWEGPKPIVCDICNQPVTSKQFVDGKTAHGPWALMCLPCFRVLGVGVGLGKGQVYDTETLEKTDG